MTLWRRVSLGDTNVPSTGKNCTLQLMYIAVTSSFRTPHSLTGDFAVVV